MTPPLNTDYLHDATVHEIGIKIGDDGNRQLRIRMQFDPDCGCAEWNSKVVDIFFDDPILISGQLYGHIANAESLNSWDNQAPDLTQAGIISSKHRIQLVFHSGSVLEVTCKGIRFVFA